MSTQFQGRKTIYTFTHFKCAPQRGRLSDGPLGHCAKETLPCTLWVGSAEPAHTENADFISAGGEAPSLGASKRCVLQAIAMQMRV